MKTIRTLITTTLGGILAMTQLATAQPPNPASDPRIDPQVRSFLAELNKDSSPFWELPQLVGRRVVAQQPGREGDPPGGPCSHQL
jgi:acetyl esterase